MPQRVGGSDGSLTWMEPDSNGRCRLKVDAQGPLWVRYEVDLLEVPVLSARSAGELSAPPRLVQPTVARKDLPSEVRHWIEQQQRCALPTWERALAVQEFVQKKYAYDLAFMSRPEVQHCLAHLAAARGNHHLRLLHASGGPEILGRGSCYEINVMVVELLRQLGVPCMVATGWLLNEGVAEWPDHLFALVVLPSSDGECLMPLDAATNSRGLRTGVWEPARERYDGDPGLPPRPQIPEVPGPWSRTGVSSRAAASDPGAEAARLIDDERQRIKQDELILCRIIRLICEVKGTAAPEELCHVETSESEPSDNRVAQLRLLAGRLLGQPELVGPLVAHVRSEFQLLPELTPAIQELVRLAVLQVRTLPVYQIWPSDREAPPKGAGQR